MNQLYEFQYLIAPANQGAWFLLGLTDLDNWKAHNKYFGDTDDLSSMSVYCSSLHLFESFPPMAPDLAANIAVIGKPSTNGNECAGSIDDLICSTDYVEIDDAEVRILEEDQIELQANGYVMQKQERFVSQGVICLVGEYQSAYEISFFDPRAHEDEDMTLLGEYRNKYPRAMKLIEKGAEFLVVKTNEPYAKQVMAMIKQEELKQGTWTGGDHDWCMRHLGVVQVGIKSGRVIGDMLKSQESFSLESHNGITQEIRPTTRIYAKELWTGDGVRMSRVGQLIIAQDSYSHYSEATFDERVKVLPLAMLHWGELLVAYINSITAEKE